MHDHGLLLKRYFYLSYKALKLVELKTKFEPPYANFVTLSCFKKILETRTRRYTPRTGL
jgi:hypothetical protein